MTWGALELCAEAGKCNTLPQLRLGARSPGRSSAAAGACATGYCGRDLQQQREHRSSSSSSSQSAKLGDVTLAFISHIRTQYMPTHTCITAFVIDLCWHHHTHEHVTSNSRNATNVVTGPNPAAAAASDALAVARRRRRLREWDMLNLLANEQMEPPTLHQE